MRDDAIGEMARLEDTHWRFVGDRPVVERALATVSAVRTIDVGSGTGGVLATLSGVCVEARARPRGAGHRGGEDERAGGRHPEA